MAKTIDAFDEQAAREAVRAGAHCIQSGGVVAFPTETFYGLGAHALDTQACQRIFQLKGRTAEKGLPLILATVEQLSLVAPALPQQAARLASVFWPGPLTLVVQAYPDVAAAQHGTIAVRVSGWPLARALAAAVGAPITATSVNPSGAPPAETALEVDSTFGDGLDLILNGGRTAGGVPSTIVDVTGSEARLLRAGAIPFERVRAVLASGS